MEMVLEDGSSAVALGGGVGHWLKIAVGALGGGGGRRSCDNGISVDIGINAIKAVGLLLQCLARMAREDVFDARDVRQWQWQGDRHITAAVAVAALQMQR
jgi:hypothetical protein